MYNHKLRFASQIFETGQTIPQNTSDPAAVGLRVAGQEGNLAIVFRALTETTIAITENLILSMQDSDDDADTDAYAAIVPAHVLTIHATAEIVYAVGDIIARIIIPAGTKDWVKPVLATDDAAATGTIDTFLEYLAN